MKIRLTFLEPVLGTWPSNENVARDFIASKAPDASTIEDEIAALGADVVADKGMTVFPRANGCPVLYDYQIKGFFKDACGMLTRVKSTKSSSLKAYKKIIDGLIFVEPRHIPIQTNGEIGECQRPLRAPTPQGERLRTRRKSRRAARSSLKLRCWMKRRTRISSWNGWITGGSEALASGGTPERDGSPTKCSNKCDGGAGSGRDRHSKAMAQQGCDWL